MNATLLITMSEADAETFVADWLLDAHAPVLTGGHQENPVVVTGIAPIGKQGRCPDDDPLGAQR